MGAIRATAIAVLAGVSLAGAAVAGMEKALQEQPAPPPAALPVPVVPAVPETPVVAAEPAAALLPPCRAAARACVRLSTESAWVWGMDGTMIGPVPVRVGRADSPTPVGAFPVETKRLDHVSSFDGTSMPFAVFFADDVAIYQGDLTRPSAGSVRLPAGAAATFFEALGPGDLVQVVP
ncbi:MAG: L,D-transpeptidase [Actinomycetota bacterium]|nr:L,D-transpeptidase [Actinomycetota bacterium]